MGCEAPGPGTSILGVSGGTGSLGGDPDSSGALRELSCAEQGVEASLGGGGRTHVPCCPPPPRAAVLFSSSPPCIQQQWELSLRHCNHM